MDKTTTNNRPALGKGLASLLAAADKAPPPPMPATAVSSTTESAAEEKGGRMPGITMVDINAIEANVFQPRRDFDETALAELSESIKAKGVIQPLIVRRGPGAKFLLIAGERRLRAAKLAGQRQVPVVVRQSSDKESLELALIENIQRENLNCIEVALSYFQLIEDFQLTQDEVSKRVGKDRSSVANHVRLLKLPEEIIKDLREGKLSFGHGKALLALKDSVQRMRVREKILADNLSVRETEEFVTSLIAAAENAAANEGKKETAESSDKEALRHLAQRIGRAFGAKVALKGQPHKGTIVIKYFSREDLDRIVEQLMR